MLNTTHTDLHMWHEVSAGKSVKNPEPLLRTRRIVDPINFSCKPPFQIKQCPSQGIMALEGETCGYTMTPYIMCIWQKSASLVVRRKTQYVIYQILLAVLQHLLRFNIYLLYFSFTSTVSDLKVMRYQVKQSENSETQILKNNRFYKTLSKLKDTTKFRDPPSILLSNGGEQLYRVPVSPWLMKKL